MKRRNNPVQASSHPQQTQPITLESIYTLLLNLQSRVDSELTLIKASQTSINTQLECIQSSLTSVQKTLTLTQNNVAKLNNPSRKHYTRFTQLPFEIVTLILSWVKPWHVFKYRRVSKLFDACLMTKQFAAIVVSQCFADDEFHDHRQGLAISYAGWSSQEMSTVLRDFPKQVQEVAISCAHSRLKILEIDCRFDENGAVEPFSETFQIPYVFGNLIGLKVLRITCPEFVGPVPLSLWDLNQLEELQLTNFQLNQELPSNISGLTSLAELDLQQTGLFGKIPTAIGLLVNLKLLNLSNNRLTGGIPSEIGNLSSLENINLLDNLLEGPLPPTLGNLSKLEVLLLLDNQMNGEIPKELGNLTSLRQISLFNNQLSGPVPQELRLLKNLRECDLRLNPGLTCDFASDLIEL